MSRLVAAGVSLGLAMGVGLTSAVIIAAHDAPYACEFPPPEVTSSVYRVTMNGRTGGSAVLTAGGWYSAAHVLNERAALEALPENGKQWDGKPIHNAWVTPKTDAGKFESDLAHTSTLKWATAAPKRGERVWSMGYPLGKELTVTTGHVNGIAKESQWLYHSAPAMLGMSGGPVVACDQERGWEVVGITSAIASAPQQSPFGPVLRVPVPFMAYASTPKQHLDNLRAHNWGGVPW